MGKVIYKKKWYIRAIYRESYIQKQVDIKWSSTSYM